MAIDEPCKHQFYMRFDRMFCLISARIAIPNRLRSPTADDGLRVRLS